MVWGKLSEEWNSVDEIIIYGFGNTAEVYIDNLCKSVNVKFIIDNSERFIGKNYNGIPIYSYNVAKDMIKNTKIVIMAETVIYNEISNELRMQEYKENIDFTGIERFIEEWYYKHLGKACIMEIHTAITTCCTFNCRNCNMYMPYYKEKVIYSLEALKSNIDLLFEYIDYVFKYQILGGEPLLNKSLPDFLFYLKDVYGDKIGRIRIITNGSVLPSDRLLEALKYSDSEVHVSDYSANIDYKNRFEATMQAFEKSGIKNKIMPSLKWRDFGFPNEPCNFEDVRKHMLTCGTAWHGLVDGCLFYCNSSWSAQKCGLFKCAKDDFIDLTELPKGEKGEIQLLQLCLGDMKSGYNSFCRLCGGCGEDNNNMVDAGIQM